MSPRSVAQTEKDLSCSHPDSTFGNNLKIFLLNVNANFFPAGFLKSVLFYPEKTVQLQKEKLLMK